MIVGCIFARCPCSVTLLCHPCKTKFGLQALYEKECHMALQDRVQEQTNEAKNALEAYVYGLRNKLYDQLSEFVTDDFKESTSKRLEQMEVESSLHLLCSQDDLCKHRLSEAVQQQLKGCLGQDSCILKI